MLTSGRVERTRWVGGWWHDRGIAGRGFVRLRHSKSAFHIFRVFVQNLRQNWPPSARSWEVTSGAGFIKRETGLLLQIRTVRFTDLPCLPGNAVMWFFFGAACQAGGVTGGICCGLVGRSVCIAVNCTCSTASDRAINYGFDRIERA